MNRKLTSTEAFGVCMAALGVAVAGGIVITMLLGLLGCADQRDMSRREAIEITKLAKELQ